MQDSSMLNHSESLDNGTAQQILSVVMRSMSEIYSSTMVGIWFDSMKLISLEDGKAVFLTENEFKRRFITEKYRDILGRLTSEAIGFEVEAEIVAPETVQKTEDEPRAEQTDREAEEDDFTYYKLRYSSSYTFENFVVGKSNQLAQAASYEVALHPAQLNNPLFLYGPSGLGKTHLMFAIMNEIRKNNKNFKMLYVTGEEFTNELVDSLARKKPVAFREKYRNLDVLLADDIQFIAGKDATEEEFFHTFDTLYKENKQIILASDIHPREIKFEERLMTRFEMGLIADIQPPDPELRAAIFKRKAADLDMNLSSDVLSFLADNISLNIRQIEGSLKKLKANSLITGQEIDLRMSSEVLADFIKNTEASENIVDRVFELIFRRYGISAEILTSEKRNAEIAQARHIAVYLVRALTPLSQKNVAKVFGRKDHTTVSNSENYCLNRASGDPRFQRELTNMLDELKTKKK